MGNLAGKTPGKKPGRKPKGRRFMDDRQDPTRLPAVYQFVAPGKDGCRKQAIPVWLETQDPNFYITGKAEIVGFNPKDMDKAVMRMIREERKIAYTAFYFLSTQPKLPEREYGKLKPKAREAFLLMEQINEELVEADEEEADVLHRQMVELGEELHDLVEKSRYYPEAMSFENPYIKGFLSCDRMSIKHIVTYQMAQDLCHHIAVDATITDEDWLADPKYKGDEGFYIPKMKINRITAYPKFTDYRDILPGKFRSKFSTQNHASRGKELYRQWDGREEAVLRLKKSRSRKS